VAFYDEDYLKNQGGVLTMTRKSFGILFLIFLIFLLAACGGNLRYSQAAPEAKNFHPGKITVLPVDVGIYPEAGGVIDPIVTTVLADRGWFSPVVSTDEVKKVLASSEELRRALTEYTQKLQAVSFSDPDLSRKIGEGFAVDAFLIVHVDYWNYAVESDNKVAKAGLAMKLVEAATGKIVWKAAHDESREYKFFKPAIPDVAKSVAKDMIYCMPH
jgi:hypothetical protein